jgi:hypothetical protein
MMQGMALSLLAVGLLSTPAQAASLVVSEGAEPNDTLSTAQDVSGNGSAGVSVPEFVEIAGSLSNAADVDLFKLLLEGGSSFSAEVTNTLPELDTRLFLFDVLGQGVFANDDIDTDNGNLLSQIAGVNLSSGTYYLAIGTYDNNALTSDGAAIFALANNSTGIVSAFDPNNATLASWSGPSQGNGGIGSYSLKLTGVQVTTPETTPVPEPASTLGLLAFGVLGAGSLVRRRQKTHKQTNSDLVRG